MRLVEELLTSYFLEWVEWNLTRPVGILTGELRCRYLSLAVPNFEFESSFSLNSTG